MANDRKTSITSSQIRKHTIIQEDISPSAFTFQEPVEDKDLITPPVSPSEGDRYLIPNVTEGGINWTEYKPGGVGISGFSAVASDNDGSNLIAGGKRLYTSSDSGVNWTERQPAGDVDLGWESVASDSDGSNLIACRDTGIDGDRLYTSSDSGVNWTERQPAGDVDRRWRSADSDADGSNLIVGNGKRLYTSSDSGVNWTERQPAGDVDRVWKSVASDADGSNLIASVYGGRLYTSSDSGVNWTERQPAGNADKNWICVASGQNGTKLIASVYAGRIYTSSDSGANWTERQPAGDVDRDWYSVASDNDGSNLIVVIKTGRLYTSSDSGVNWTERQPAGDVDRDWYSVASDNDGSNLIVGIGNLYTYISSNAWITNYKNIAQYISSTWIFYTPAEGWMTWIKDENKIYQYDGSSWTEFTGSGLSNIVEDLTPQLGGDLDLNGKNIDFPTTPNISDCLDEDNMVSDSATKLATQQSIKAYSDTKLSNSDPYSLDGAVTINESGADKDFRVEGSGETNALFVQGSDGFVGIGTIPTYKFHIDDEGSTDVWTAKIEGGDNALQLTTKADATGDILSIRPKGVAAFNIDANGAVDLIRGQIKFPATAVPSADPNTIDDYEEGYYTAALTCGTSGTITINSDIDQLVYTKIGRVVTVQGEIRVSAISSPLGSLIINLPFTVTALEELADVASGQCGYYAVNAFDTAGLLFITVNPGAATAKIREVTTTTLLNDIANHFIIGSYVTVALSYIVE